MPSQRLNFCQASNMSSARTSTVIACRRRVPLFPHGSYTVVKITASCAMSGVAKWGLSNDRDWVVSFRKRTRVRLGERRREAKLSCQRILELMDCERRQREEHCAPSDAAEDEAEATLH